MRIRAEQRHAVLEVGIDRRGQMARYARVVRPDVAVVTSIGWEHHLLSDLETARTEKAAMVRALAPSGLAVLNGDDPNVAWMATQTDAEIRTFGFAAANHVRATDVEIDWPRGMTFTLHADGQRRRGRVRLVGRHMLYPVLAAVSVALASEVMLDVALSALEALAPTPRRLEPVPLANGAYLLRDEHKSPLPTMEAALDVLAEIPAERRIVVLGDLEDLRQSPDDVYAYVGSRVASIASQAVFVHFAADGPRYAPAAERSGLPSERLFTSTRGVLDAVESLRAILRPGDVVLLKGAGAQRLDRIALALDGRGVRCELRACKVKTTRCDLCPMLDRGLGNASTLA
jgi:UDP-N-acetylmuramoyl-tripeptide--D-alanyl-D-alanine ligase